MQIDLSILAHFDTQYYVLRTGSETISIGCRDRRGDGRKTSGLLLVACGLDHGEEEETILSDARIYEAYILQ